MTQTFLTIILAAVLQVIPLPNDIRTNGKFAGIGAEISAPEALKAEAACLSDAIAGYKTDGGSIRLTLDPSLKEEEYVMTVKKGRTVISGGSPAGVFYGIQTLIQEAGANGGKLPCGTIKDAPRYAWRGLMLDESRHFFGEKTVKELLDFMARYKLNKFHWHLTDSPGWRIEIKAYPELTGIGAKGNHTDPNAPCTFYTQDQIREIIAYAAARHIEVIPEIDMPGHASSANRAFPSLGVGDQPGSFTYNPGKEEVYTFIANVLKEVAALFPSQYLHFGGDEVALGNKSWASDPYIKALMEREGFTDIKEAEAYFHKRLAPIVHSLGKKMIGWDDILDLPGGKQSDMLTWWRHDKLNHLTEGQEQGYGMILCPRLPLYFDFVQDASHTSGRKWHKGGKFNPLDSVYAFPESIEGQWDNGGVLGMQANLWTETVHTPKRVQYMIFPRICALAEAAWTLPEGKDYSSFLSRLEKEYSLFESLGIYYCDFRDLNRHPEIKQ